MINYGKTQLKFLAKRLLSEQIFNQFKFSLKSRNMYPQPFSYCIDYPKANEDITNPYLIVSGWITSDQGNVIEKPILSNGDNYSQPLSINHRPDVKAVFPDRSVLGFQEGLSVTDLINGNNWHIEFYINGEIYSFPIKFSIDTNLLSNISNISKKKLEKLQKIKNILSCPICQSEKLQESANFLLCDNCRSEFNFNQNHYHFLTQNLTEIGNIKPTANVSANGYDPKALDIIKKYPDGLILDNGCGLRNFYYDNVVNFEIVNYPTTDVIGIGEKLPFKSNSFDAVFSFAVLEHVRNPFECAKEIIRVLKPGGIIYVAVPFLQPFHGYPDHYYNMTSNGLKNLFAEKLQIIEDGVPLSGVPIWTLSWFLNSYVQGLPPSIAEKFKNMKVSELMADPMSCLYQDFVQELSAAAKEELACVNYIIATKVSQ